MRTAIHRYKTVLRHPLRGSKANSHAALQRVRRKVKNLYLLSLLSRNRYKTLSTAIGIAALCTIAFWVFKNKF